MLHACTIHHLATCHTTRKAGVLSIGHACMRGCAPACHAQRLAPLEARLAELEAELRRVAEEGQAHADEYRRLEGLIKSAQEKCVVAASTCSTCLARIIWPCAMMRGTRMGPDALPP